ncbi:MAG TPA: prepilin-type N-terminal cleavage/methylation domain-containing protein [Limnobacter sp.]|nr:prepilin-type N-terminal cleavage/methylation domain-containing protein [Limnobacter sp.]
MRISKRLARVKVQRGFTLIELMIAIAIVGTLAAIAVPQFTNYLVKARVAEAVNYAQACKTGYAEFYATNLTLPTSNDEANCASVTTDNIAAVQITSGTGAAAAPAIRIQLVAAAPMPVELRNLRIVLQPLDPNNNMLNAGERIENWRCSLTNDQGVTAPNNAREFMPAVCRNSIVTT